MRVVCWLVVMGACNGDKASDDTPTDVSDADTDADADADADADTDADSDTDIDWAACAVQPDNALRVDCALTNPQTGATWTLTQGARTRTARSEVGGSATIWGLTADTPTQWTVELDDTGMASGGGTLQTGSLPVGIATMEATASGTATGTEAIAIPYTCDGMGGVAVYTTDAELIWYEQRAVAGMGTLAGMTGFDWTDNGVLLSFDGDRLVELTPEGVVNFDITSPGRPLHHDIAGGSPYRYALNAALDGNIVVDGFYVLDDSGDIIAEWDLRDHVIVGTTGIGAFWQLEFPFSVDWSHANSVELDGPDHVLLSFKHLNALMRVASNPTRSDFGTIEWVLDGGGSTLDSDYTWSGGGEFRDQHHVSRLSDGNLAVFDNLSMGRSRALLLDIDDVAGTVSEGQWWEHAARCAVQGSIYERPDGSFLSMCTSAGAVWEFHRGEPDPSYTLDLLCVSRSGGAGHLARAIPVDL